MRFLFLLLLVSAGTSLFAQGLVTVDGPSHHGAFATFDQAEAFAVSGDVVTLPGGQFSAANQAISKRLTIIGAGHDPRYATATGITLFTTNLRFIPGSEGSRLAGMLVNQLQILTDGSTPFYVDRCNINNVVASGTFWLTRSIIRSEVYWGNGPAANSLIANNIIFGKLRGLAGCENSSARNNVFLTTSEAPLNNLTSISAQKNIFLGLAQVDNLYSGSYIGFNFFTDDALECNTTCSYGTQDNQFSMSQSQLFETTPITTSGSTWRYTMDFVLTANSPARYGTTDEYDDAGIYGGDFPWKEGSLPEIPHVTGNSTRTSATGATLQVNVTAEAQNE